MDTNLNITKGVHNLNVYEVRHKFTNDSNKVSLVFAYSRDEVQQIIFNNNESFGYVTSIRLVKPVTNELVIHLHEK